MKNLILAALSCSLIACGGGGGGSSEKEPIAKQPVVETPTKETPDAWVFKDRGTSMTLKGNELGSFIYGFGKLDVNHDGYDDLVITGPDWTGNGFGGAEVPFSVLVNDQHNGFYHDNSAMFGDVEAPTQVHTRDIIQADFNSDGTDDMLFVGHGWDIWSEEIPTPGEKLKLITSEGGVWVDSSENLNHDIEAFFHTSAVGDVNSDGYPDIIAIDGFHWDRNGGDNADRVLPLINDGLGNFTPRLEMMPANLRSSDVEGGRAYGWITSELMDLDGDSCVDLILAGDRQWHDSYISWNKCGDLGFEDKTGSMVLPAPIDEEFTLLTDIKVIDVNQDGNPDMMMSYTRKDYHGNYIQVLINTGYREYEDQTEVHFPNQDIESHHWVTKIQDVDIDNDGDLDLVFLLDFADILAVVWENKNGVFESHTDEIFDGSLLPIDIDNDGDIDLVNRVVTYLGTPSQVVSFNILENLTNQ